MSEDEKPLNDDVMDEAAAADDGMEFDHHDAPADDASADDAGDDDAFGAVADADESADGASDGASDGAADGAGAGTDESLFAEPEAPAAAAGADMLLPGDFKQNWALLFCYSAMFVACVWLPIEGKVLDLYAKDSISGGFLTVFALYGVMATYAGLYHRKMIAWPMFLCMMDGFWVSIRRLIQLVNQMPDGAGRDEWVRLAGPGLWVILICSLIILKQIFGGLKEGRDRAIAREEEKKAARGSRR